MFLFLFCLFVSLAFGLLPLKPEGEHTLAKSVWGQQTIHFMLRDEFLTRDHAERLEVRPVFRDLRALRCPHSLNPQIFTSRSERETWGPVTFWNETRRFWGQHVTSPGLQRVAARGRVPFCCSFLACQLRLGHLSLLPSLEKRGSGHENTAPFA